MNPVLSLLDYSIYECTGIDAITKKEYFRQQIFVIKMAVCYVISHARLQLL